MHTVSKGREAVGTLFRIPLSPTNQLMLRLDRENEEFQHWLTDWKRNAIEEAAV